MDKGLMVDIANRHDVHLDTRTRAFASDIFEAGQKNGFYHVLRLTDDGWADLDDVAVNDLSYNRVSILDLIAQKFKEAKVAYVTMIEERLALAIVGRHAAEEHLAEAKEALKHADICEKVAHGEVAVLEQMLKELKP